MYSIIKCGKCSQELIFLSIKENENIEKIVVTCPCGEVVTKTVMGSVKLAPADKISMEYTQEGTIECQKTV